MLADVSTMKMMYSLSTGMPPIASAFGRLAWSLQHALHLFGERLIGRDELAFDDVGHRTLPSCSQRTGRRRW